MSIVCESFLSSQKPKHFDLLISITIENRPINPDYLDKYFLRFLSLASFAWKLDFMNGGLIGIQFLLLYCLSMQVNVDWFLRLWAVEQNVKNLKRRHWTRHKTTNQRGKKRPSSQLKSPRANVIINYFIPSRWVFIMIDAMCVWYGTAKTKNMQK